MVGSSKVDMHFDLRLNCFPVRVTPPAQQKYDLGSVYSGVYLPAQHGWPSLCHAADGFAIKIAFNYTMRNFGMIVCTALVQCLHQTLVTGHKTRWLPYQHGFTSVVYIWHFESTHALIVNHPYSSNMFCHFQPTRHLPSFTFLWVFRQEITTMG